MKTILQNIRAVLLVMLMMVAGVSEVYAETIEPAIKNVSLSTDNTTVQIGQEIQETVTYICNSVAAHIYFYSSPQESAEDRTQIYYKDASLEALSYDRSQTIHFNHTFTEAGTYYLSAVVVPCTYLDFEMVDGWVTSNYVKVEVKAPSADISANVSEVDADEEITLTATTEAGSPSYTYYYSTDGGANYNVLETTSSSSVKFKSNQAGNYMFKVKVTSYDLSTYSSPIQVTFKDVDPYLTATVSPSELFTDNPVTIKTTSVCYIPENYTYSYSVDGSEYKEIETTANSSCTFSPSTAGTYTFKVSSGTLETTTPTVKVNERTATISAQDMVVCAEEEITVFGSFNFTPKYIAYYVKKDDGEWTLLKEGEPNWDTLFLTYTPTQDGLYYFKVTVSDGTYSATSDAVCITVNAINPNVKISASPTTVYTGEPVTLTATPVCCTPTEYWYNYNYGQEDEKYELIANSADETYTFTPTKAGTYKFNVEVYTYDATGNEHIYNGYSNVITVKDRPTQTITPNANGVLSCVATYPLDFSSIEGLKAYVATNVNSSTITLKSVDKVAQGEAFIITGTAETSYNVSSIATFTHEDGYVNLFQAADGEKKASEYGSYVYCLNTDGNFQQVGSDVVIPSGKAFLTLSSPAKALTLDFGDDFATAIQAVNGKQSSVNNNVMYNLAGQRVNANAKGIIIKNGKKFIK